MLKYIDEALRFRHRLIPKSNELRSVEVVDCWAVRWTSRNGEWHGDTQPEVEVFVNRELAEEFAESLRFAFSLLRHRGPGTKVYIERSDGPQH